MSLIIHDHEKFKESLTFELLKSSPQVFPPGCPSRPSEPLAFRQKIFQNSPETSSTGRKQCPVHMEKDILGILIGKSQHLISGAPDHRQNILRQLKKGTVQVN